MLHGGVDDRRGVGTGGAFQVFELVDRDTAPAGGLIMEVSLKLFAVLGGAENWADAI